MILINPSNQYWNGNPNQPNFQVPQGNPQMPGQNNNYINNGTFLNFFQDNYLTELICFFLPIFGHITFIKKFQNLNKELKKYRQTFGYFAKNIYNTSANQNHEIFIENFLKNPSMYLQSYKYGNFKKMPEKSFCFSFLYYLSKIITYIACIFLTICTILFLCLIFYFFSGKKDEDSSVKNHILILYIVYFFASLIWSMLPFFTYQVTLKEEKLREIKEKFGNLMELPFAQNIIIQCGFYGQPLNEFVDYYYNFISN